MDAHFCALQLLASSRLDEARVRHQAFLCQEPIIPTSSTTWGPAAWISAISIGARACCTSASNSRLSTRTHAWPWTQGYPQAGDLPHPGGPRNADAGSGGLTP